MDYNQQNNNNQNICLAFTVEDVEAEYIKVEVSQAVREAVRELKPEYAQAIWLGYFEDFTNPDGARVMKKTRH